MSKPISHLPLSNWHGRFFVSNFLDYIKNNTDTNVLKGKDGSDYLSIGFPFGALRGDGLCVYVHRLPDAVYVFGDGCYVHENIDTCVPENCRDKFFEIENKVLSQYGIKKHNDEWYVKTSHRDAGRGLFNLAMGLMEISVVLCYQ